MTTKPLDQPSAPIRQQILLVEDEENLGYSLVKYFQGEGFQVDWVKSLLQARQFLAQKSLPKNSTMPDLVVLDWMLPDGQGIDLLQEWRKQDLSFPIIMLTARTDLIDKVLGLESGASDYLTKPFEPRELLARVRAQLRQMRTQQQSQQSHQTLPTSGMELVLVLGEIRMDLQARQCFFQQKKIELTRMEYDLLLLFIQSPNRVFSREEILNKVWGLENYPTTRTVDTHILQLRQKLRDDLFETVRGIGYRLKQHNS